MTSPFDKDNSPLNQRALLHDTLAHLKSALEEWDKIPEKEESRDDELFRKTRDLIKDISLKIRELDL